MPTDPATHLSVRPLAEQVGHAGLSIEVNEWLKILDPACGKGAVVRMVMLTRRGVVEIRGGEWRGRQQFVDLRNLIPNVGTRARRARTHHSAMCVSSH